MTYVVLIPFFIIFIIFFICSKPDLYTHQHEASTIKALDNFNANFKAIEDLEIENNYKTSNTHIYNSK
ncbi:MAG: hypothetical protein ABJQ39_06305 [Winogradskyella arenosi]